MTWLRDVVGAILTRVFLRYGACHHGAVLVIILASMLGTAVGSARSVVVVHVVSPLQDACLLR